MLKEERSLARAEIVWVGLAAALVVGGCGMEAPQGQALAGALGPEAYVSLCHRTSSERAPWIPIRVSRRALGPHLGHGDVEAEDGVCPSADPGAATEPSDPGEEPGGASCAGWEVFSIDYRYCDLGQLAVVVVGDFQTHPELRLVPAEVGDCEAAGPMLDAASETVGFSYLCNVDNEVESYTFSVSVGDLSCGEETLTSACTPS